MRSVPALTGVALWGLCDAASASLMYCTQDARVKGVAIANPWVRSQAGQAQSYIKHYYGQRLLQRSFWVKAFSGKLHVTASVTDFLRKLWRSRSAGASAAQGSSFIERMRHGLQKFSGPTLILMSERDLTAQEFRDLSAASADWQKALRRAGVTMIYLPGADHTFSTAGALELATRHSLEWLRTRASP